jgi:hypothetical protein
MFGPGQDMHPCKYFSACLLEFEFSFCKLHSTSPVNTKSPKPTTTFSKLNLGNYSQRLISLNSNQNIWRFRTYRQRALINGEDGFPISKEKFSPTHHVIGFSILEENRWILKKRLAELSNTQSGLSHLQGRKERDRSMSIIFNNSHQHYSCRSSSLQSQAEWWLQHHEMEAAEAVSSWEAPSSSSR